jgi:hypothetical protein
LAVQCHNAKAAFQAVECGGNASTTEPDHHYIRFFVPLYVLRAGDGKRSFYG